MAFGKLFGRRDRDDTPPTGNVGDEPVDQPGESAPEEEWLDGSDVDRQWTDRALAVLPGGSSTGSRQPQAIYGSDPDGAPTHYARAHGCVLTTPAGRNLIDCTMALGSVSLGYGDDGVVRGVIEAAAGGNVAGLASVLEVDLAERLCDVIPCAEQVRFLKTGADAVAAAVRIARAATGRSVVICSGYFGWHDWSNEGKGIPASAHTEVRRVPFDDVNALEAAIAQAGADLACVLLEPVQERLPSAAWIESARSGCARAGAIFILDEMKTGFRLASGGYQALTGQTPDLAVFGKAMACGFPVAALVGSKAVMDAARGTWITTTAAGESSALGAVAAVLERYAELDVCASLARAGAQMRESVGKALEASGLEGVTIDGLDEMWYFRFADATRESRFLRTAARTGILFKRGAYNYAALAHDNDDVQVEIERLASTTFVNLVEEIEADEADEERAE
ncbi:MAG: aminotransferase class III-fold pyridoxal phosphate-dependent enzyme [Gemmatimonadota bacterium]